MPVTHPSGDVKAMAGVQKGDAGVPGWHCQLSVQLFDSGSTGDSLFPLVSPTSRQPGDPGLSL